MLQYTYLLFAVHIDLTVGRVRVIFQAPALWLPLAPHPLAYVEWFTPLAVYDDALAIYSVKPSMHNHYRAASVIPITDITRSCHLVPQWGKSMDRTWNQRNVHEKCERFYVNPYLRLSDFVLFRYVNRK